jgi:hypothetical protein
MSSELIARLPTEMIGGGRVFRPFSTYRRNEVLSADVIRSLPRQNLKALIDQRFLIVWPVGSDPAPSVAADEEVFIYARAGTSRFDVVVGRRLNAVPLSKADAEKLAAAQREPAAA